MHLYNVLAEWECWNKITADFFERNFSCDVVVGLEYISSAWYVSRYHHRIHFGPYSCIRTRCLDWLPKVICRDLLSFTLVQPHFPNDIEIVLKPFLTVFYRAGCVGNASIASWFWHWKASNRIIAEEDYWKAWWYEGAQTVGSLQNCKTSSSFS